MEAAVSGNKGARGALCTCTSAVLFLLTLSAVYRSAYDRRPGHHDWRHLRCVCVFQRNWGDLSLLLCGGVHGVVVVPCDGSGRVSASQPSSREPCSGGVPRAQLYVPTVRLHQLSPTSGRSATRVFFVVCCRVLCAVCPFPLTHRHTLCGCRGCRSTSLVAVCTVVSVFGLLAAAAASTTHSPYLYMPLEVTKWLTPAQMAAKAHGVHTERDI